MTFVIAQRGILAYAVMEALAGLEGVMLAGNLNSIQATFARFLNSTSSQWWS